MMLQVIFRNGAIRLTLWAVFIVLVAALARLADLSTAWIIAVIFIAWLLVAVVERSAYRAVAGAAGRQAAGAVNREEAPPAPGSTATRPSAAPPSPAALVQATQPAPLPVPVAASRRAEPELWLDDDSVIDPGPAPFVPAPVASAPVASVPAGPAVVEPVTPAPEAPVAVPAEPEPLPPPVPLVPRGPATGQGAWNLWELERIAREVAGSDRARDEERSLILMYLREFANAEGMLGREFDDLVRESFGDLLPQR